MIRPPPKSPLFPYTTLFRSFLQQRVDADSARPTAAHGPVVQFKMAGKSAPPILIAFLSQHDRINEPRSEEHTSELQSHVNLVCRLLLEKKNNIYINKHAGDS